MSAYIGIEVVYALPSRQVVRSLSLTQGATALSAVVESRLSEEFPEIVPEAAQLACFGKLIGRDAVLRDGDRVEILRPLLADPKEARRRKAETQAAGKKLR